MKDAKQISVTKGKVGPITERYANGKFRSVGQTNEGPKKVAICGLDNSHNGDYKVSYASDALLIVTANDGSLSHSDLQSLLEKHDLWMNELNPILVPYTDSDGDPSWRVGFKSLPRSANQLDRFKHRMSQAVQRDMDYIDGDTSVHAYLPVE